MVHEFIGLGIQAKLLTGRTVGVTSITQDRGQYIVLIDYYDDDAYYAHHCKISREYFYREEYHPLDNFYATSVMEILHAFFNCPKKQQLEFKLPYLRINERGTWSHANIASYARSVEYCHKDLIEKATYLDDVAGIDPYASEEQKQLFGQVRARTKEVIGSLVQILADLKNMGIDHRIAP